MKNRETVLDAIADQLVTLMGPQFAALGIKPSAPPTGSFVSKRSRGYLYGVAARVADDLSEGTRVALSGEIFQMLFSIVYGAALGLPLFKLTLDECVARDGETLSGAHYAEDDVSAVFRGDPNRTVMGFWLLNNGVGVAEEKMPELLTFDPFPQLNCAST